MTLHKPPTKWKESLSKVREIVRDDPKPRAIVFQTRKQREACYYDGYCYRIVSHCKSMQRKIWRCYNRTCVARLWTTPNPDEGLLEVRGVHDHAGESFDTVLQSRVDLAAYLAGGAPQDPHGVVETKLQSSSVDESEIPTEPLDHVEQHQPTPLPLLRRRRGRRMHTASLRTSLEVGGSNSLEWPETTTMGYPHSGIGPFHHFRRKRSASPECASPPASREELEHVELVLNSMCAVARMDVDRVMDIVAYLRRQKRAKSSGRGLQEVKIDPDLQDRIVVLESPSAT